MLSYESEIVVYYMMIIQLEQRKHEYSYEKVCEFPVI